MKQLYIFTIFILTVNIEAIVSKQEAIEFVLDSLVNRDTTKWVYMIPDSIPKDTIIRNEWGQGNIGYTNPYEWCWFFFIDDCPPANWGHPCRYVLISYLYIGYRMVIFEDTPPAYPDGSGGYIGLEKIFPQGVKENSNCNDLFNMIKIFSNPSYSYIQVEYYVPQKSYVSLKIYDNAGKFVKNLFEGNKEKGVYRICWDKHNNEGKKVASGNYFCKFNFDGVEVTKLVIVH